MNEKKFRTIHLYKAYFKNFFSIQNQKVKDKILWTFRIIETQRLIPTEYLKHLTGTEGLYEIRVKRGSNIYRTFCFFDQGKIIVIINGFHKKTQKTPRSEIKRALKIKAEYEKGN